MSTAVGPDVHTQAPGAAPPARLHRDLGVLTLAGTIYIFVASGPFGLEAMVRDGGPGAAVLMLVAGLLFWGLSHALVATELSSAVPEEGGFVRWVEMAFGGFFGFLAAYWYWIKMLADTSIYPIQFAQYLRYWWPDMTVGEGRLVRIALIWLFVAVNLRGIKAGGRLAVGFSLFILAPFVAFVILGAPHFTPRAFTPLVAEGKGLVEGLGLALMLGMWCYNTLDSVSVVAGEVENPRRTFGRAYLLAIPCIFLGYVLPIIVASSVDPNYAAWEDHQFSILGRRLGGPWLGAWIAFGALISNVSLFHAALMVNTRVPMVLATQRRFPAMFAAIGARYGSPWVSLLFEGTVYTAIALVAESFIDIVVWNQWLNMGIYSLLYLAFLRLRWKRPDLPRKFKVPGGWFGAIAICIGPFLICWVGVPLGGQMMVGAGLIGLASGPVAYFLLRAVLGRGAAEPPRTGGAAPLTRPADSGTSP